MWNVNEEILYTLVVSRMVLVSGRVCLLLDIKMYDYVCTCPYMFYIYLMWDLNVSFTFIVWLLWVNVMGFVSNDLSGSVPLSEQWSKSTY